MRFCREIGALYIDTVVEPWPGFYFDKSLGNEARTNYALRETVLAERRANPGGTTAVSCCGANPGMVSWFVKQALVNLAADLGDRRRPSRRRARNGAKLAQTLGVKGVHIAERDTQRAKNPKPRNVFVNTWSVEGFLSEGMQPAELGWGTHEKWAPANAGFHEERLRRGDLHQPARRQHPRALLDADGARRSSASSSPTTSRSRSPTITPCATTRARRSTGRPATTPITPATTRCCRCTSCSASAGKMQTRAAHSRARPRSSTGSTNSACCSTATPATPIGTARSSRSRRRATLAPYQNATGMQVTSAVLAGMVWALENPKAGIVEADEMDFSRCLEVQTPYLGPVVGVYTDWTPLDRPPGPVPRGHRRERSLAVPQRAGAVAETTRCAAIGCARGACQRRSVSGKFKGLPRHLQFA